MTASRAARFDAAWKLYLETKAPAAKLYRETEDSAWKLYQKTVAKIEAEP